MALDEQRETDSRPDLTAALNQLWMRFLPEMHERVAVLRSTAYACTVGNLLQADREAAHAAAHKLAGTLGTFSLTRGTELAREFEQICASGNSLSVEKAAQLTALATEIDAIISNRQ